MHVGLMEKLEASGVAIGNGAEGASTTDLEANLSNIIRTKVAILVHNTYRDISQVLAIGINLSSIYRKL